MPLRNHVSYSNPSVRIACEGCADNLQCLILSVRDVQSLTHLNVHQLTQHRPRLCARSPNRSEDTSHRKLTTTARSTAEVVWPLQTVHGGRRNPCHASSSGPSAPRCRYRPRREPSCGNRKVGCLVCPERYTENRGKEKIYQYFNRGMWSLLGDLCPVELGNVRQS